MDFSQKASLCIGSTTYHNGGYEKPLICPQCGFGTDGTITAVVSANLNVEDRFFAVSILCTHCKNNFVALYRKTSNNKMLEYVECHPRPSGSPLRECFGAISSRFAELHKQSEFAEINSLYDIAAIGYRAALEVLVKDYAINELGKPAEEVKKKWLADAISEYLNQEELVKTADVIRILGNDYAHYERAYPQHDFTILKHYYNIFMGLIAAQYDIKHPPVERK